MERVYKSSSTEIKKINNQLSILNNGFDLLYYRKFYRFEIDDKLFYINGVKEDNNTFYIINIPTDIKQLYLYNIYHTNTLKINSNDMHDVELYFINCSFNELFLYYPNHFDFKGCKCNLLEIDDLKMQTFDLSGLSSKKIKINKLNDINYNLNCFYCDGLEEIYIKQNNSLGSYYYELNMCLPGSVSSFYVDSINFDGRIQFGKDYPDRNYFKQFYINMNTLKTLEVYRDIDTSIEYVETKFKINLSSNFVGFDILTMPETLFGVFKGTYTNTNISISYLTIIDNKHSYSIPVVDSSWNASAGSVRTWTIYRLVYISGMFTTLTNLKGYIVNFTNSNITINASNFYGLQ